jgi:hypothetical protein
LSPPLELKEFAPLTERATCRFTARRA